MLDQFHKATAQLGDISIRYAMAGSGPPLLLLHGYPQTHVMWHKIAPTLAERFTVVASDMRAYGDSSKPPTDAHHSPYSKRAMGNDQVELMRQLGFEEFLLAGHDRGGRVGHRIALDHPDAIHKLAVLDIAPTYTMYRTTDMEFARAYYHCCFTPETIHASCEDYRASATIDLEHDQVDIDQGRKVQCPLLCLWGEKGFVGQKYDVIAEWKKWADQVEGKGLPCGHYLPEEAPDETLEELLNFFN